MFETAGALVAFSSAANAGITIPAGDWTVDLGGNVNAFYTNTTSSGKTSTGANAGANGNQQGIGTGLLPAEIAISGKTRQNDLDVAFTVSFWTGTSSGPAGSSIAGGFNGNGTQGGAGANTLDVRQAFLSFGDASWGQIKLGRDLGIYGSDAILSDMTLLGVGNAAPAGGNSTLGRIGSGYMYADWIGQVQYSTPNWNGFQLTGAMTQPWTNGNDTNNANNVGWQGKATYDFAANDVTGRVWVSGITQDHTNNGTGVAGYTSKGWDVGAKAAYQGAELVGYYYSGNGLSGSTAAGGNGVLFLAGANTSDSGGYVQATYKIPGIGTKLGASWGESYSQTPGNAAQFKNESWIIGAYHPLTKSLNLVAEYTDQKLDNQNYTAGDSQKNHTVSAGAILFF